MKSTHICIAILFAMLATATLHAQTPFLVKDINPSSAENVRMMLGCDLLNGVVYFDGSDGTERTLWRTDGTTSGTYEVKDIPTILIHVHDGKIYFAGTDPVDGQDPWVSDGTTNGTYRLNNLSLRSGLGKGVRNIMSTAAGVFFNYEIVDIRKYQLEEYQLWKTDGTVNGTSHVSTVAWIDYMLDGGNALYMIAAGGWYNQGSAEEPWVSDGTAAGTQLVLDICPIDGGSNDNCDEKYTPISVNSEIYYEYEKSPVVVNNTWYFNKSDGISGMELWRSDGSAAGTQRLTDINTGSASTHPTFLVEMGNVLYFTADDGSHGMELWKYPLPNGPAALVKDIADGSAGSEPLWLTPVDGTLYFSAWTSGGGRELWKSDGTTAGTVQVADIASGNASSNPDYDRLKEPAFAYRTDWRMFTAMGEKIYFAADDGNGYELYESDGTAAGTAKIADINPNTGEGSSPHYITALCDRLLFIAYHPNYGREWWCLPVGGNQAPTAIASANPVSGTAPLTVAFASTGSSDPDGSIVSWYWDFGDNGNSTEEQPTHVYLAPGTYTAQLTVTDNCSATATDNVTITVSAGSTSSLFVDQQTVGRIALPGGRSAGQSVILVKDNTGIIEGATVLASYTGPTSGTVSGTTDASGAVTLETASTKKNLNESWCFTVDDILKTGYTFTGSTGEPYACEDMQKRCAALPANCTLHPVAPNPFSVSTQVRFLLPERRHVALRLYDILGRCVMTLSDGIFDAGSHTVVFNRSGLSAGMYVLQLKTDASLEGRRVCIQ